MQAELWSQKSIKHSVGLGQALPMGDRAAFALLSGCRENALLLNHQVGNQEPTRSLGPSSPILHVQAKDVLVQPLGARDGWDAQVEMQCWAQRERKMGLTGRRM